MQYGGYRDRNIQMKRRYAINEVYDDSHLTPQADGDLLLFILVAAGTKIYYKTRKILN